MPSGRYGRAKTPHPPAVRFCQTATKPPVAPAATAGADWNAAVAATWISGPLAGVICPQVAEAARRASTPTSTRRRGPMVDLRPRRFIAPSPEPAAVPFLFFLYERASNVKYCSCSSERAAPAPPEKAGALPGPQPGEPRNPSGPLALRRFNCQRTIPLRERVSPRTEGGHGRGKRSVGRTKSPGSPTGWTFSPRQLTRWTDYMACSPELAIPCEPSEEKSVSKDLYRAPESH